MSCRELRANANDVSNSPIPEKNESPLAMWNTTGFTADSFRYAVLEFTTLVGVAGRSPFRQNVSLDLSANPQEERS